MAEAIVPQERLLYASYSPPHVYEDGTDDGQPIVTALFQEPTESGEVGYAIREYSLAKGDIFYRFPKTLSENRQIEQDVSAGKLNERQPIFGLLRPASTEAATLGQP